MILPANTNMYGFKNENKFYLYDGNTCVISESTDLINRIVELISKCSSNEIITILKDSYGEDVIENQLEKVISIIDKGIYEREKKSELNHVTEEQWSKGKILKNLWLNISNDCNLRCIYCFGHGGNYGRPKGLMSKEVAKKCIDYWFNYLDKSAKDVTVTFFGGEPLLNKEVILFSVGYINSLMTGIDTSVKYIIVTNGTILDKELIDVFVQNKVRITISMDGGELITSKNRPMLTGQSSFEKIKANVAKLKEHFNTLVARMTITSENAYKLRESVQELWDIGFTDVYYEMVSIDDKTLCVKDDDLKVIFKQLIELREITYKNMMSGEKKTLLNLVGMLSDIHFGNLNSTCSFHSPYTLMFSVDGDIYKCHRFLGSNEYAVGNIKDGVNLQKYMRSYNEFENTKCSKCWGKSICQNGCSHVNLTYNKNINEPYNLYCNHKKFLIKQGLKLYTDLYIRNPERFNTFLK